MKKLTITFLTFLLSCIGVSAQTIMFWTDAQQDMLPIKVYVDEVYAGEVTNAYSMRPEPGAGGCLIVYTDPGSHSLVAVNAKGQVYDGWPGSIRPRADEMNVLKIRNSEWVWPHRGDYVYIDWMPGDPDPFYTHHHDMEIDSYDDELEVIAMAATAFLSVMTMTFASVKHWNYPDSRFPYLGVQCREEYLFGLQEWRHLVGVKGRIGNLGGMSLIAEAGWASDDFGSSGYTYDFGLGFAFGGLEVNLRYKPLWGGIPETFAVCDFSYDWWFAKHLGLNLRAGFGTSGYSALTEYFEFPIGLGLICKF